MSSGRWTTPIAMSLGTRALESAGRRARTARGLAGKDHRPRDQARPALFTDRADSPRAPGALHHVVHVWWRLRVRLAASGGALDGQLAAGVDPRTSLVLLIRAQQLTGPRNRKRLAAGLARALRTAQSSTPGLTAAVRPHASEVLAARTVLEAVNRRLLTDGTLNARGVAILQLLLTDAGSPLYRPTEPGALASHLRTVAVALEPDANAC